MATTNNKVIALIRTSTTKQEVESQKRELIDTITADGIAPDDIIVVGGAGASAIKLDDRYKRNLNEVYRLIDEGNISAVYAWAIDRIGRNEEVLMQFKNTLIRNNVQLVIKNPSLRLLNPDGTVNNGVELAFTLFATMAKQEMETKKERFARAKRRNTESGKFNGGKTPFGYTVDDNGKITISEDEAETVRLIFSLYNSGEYSTSALAREIRERGLKVRGNDITTVFVCKIMRNTAYIGHVGCKPYPRIIGDTLFNAVGERLSANRKGAVTTQSKRINLCAKLIYCTECGSRYYANSKSYRCAYTRNYDGEAKCHNHEELSIDWADTAAWFVAKTCEMNRIVNFTAEQRQRTTEAINVNRQKIEVLMKRIQGVSERRERVAEMYIDGAIDKATQRRRMDRIADEMREAVAQIRELRDTNERLHKLITDTDNGTEVTFDRFATCGINDNKEEAYRIVHRHLKRIEFAGDKSRKDITMETVDGQVYRFVYRSKSKVKIDGMVVKLWLLTDEGETPLPINKDFVITFADAVEGVKTTYGYSN